MHTTKTFCHVPASRPQDAKWSTQPVTPKISVNFGENNEGATLPAAQNVAFFSEVSLTDDPSADVPTSISKES